MIISRTPLRISLGGGGTDLPSYFRNNGGGFLIAAAIDKHIYISVHDNFADNILLKYSKIENVKNTLDVEHPIIREALMALKIDSGLEISSMADIPAGTGLGSSGTFTVGVLKALHQYLKLNVSNTDLAKMACHIEIEKLREPIGKQDQYIAAVGGLTAFEFHSDGAVSHSQVRTDNKIRDSIEENLLLFYTGIKRSASDELVALEKGISAEDRSIAQNLNRIKEIGYQTLNCIESGNLTKFGQLLTTQWEIKYERSPSLVHKNIDLQIRLGIQAGAIGGKLIGAGGGGFLMFYAEDKKKIRLEMSKLGMREVSFRFDYLGSQIIT